ncbi:MAG TPA: acetyl-CoA carboxylase, carboxyltransferase subunit beta [Candidatus Kapabacteria bacterium]|nr:acetyl-CoA carboxylase, carboxyltransferase subunit beta [Candidatus Kapabacteria bacterium]
MAWFNRTKQNIEDQQSRDMPDGLWTKCSNCGEITYKKQLEENFYTCPKCNKHFRIGSNQYIDLLMDEGSFHEEATDLVSTDPLHFVDEKPYTARLAKGMRDTGLRDAIRIGTGTIEGLECTLAVMDFSFIGGSMGSVVGEKFSRAVDLARERRIPLVAITASGGARMMEAAISLMQMAKTSVRLAQLAEARVPYFVVLTDPTTGGVTASFAMLGDVILAEPNALIGFAGPRVIEQMTKKKLPEGFQRSEFQLKHGFVDHIVHRKDLRRTLSRLFTLLPVPAKAQEIASNGLHARAEA